MIRFTRLKPGAALRRYLREHYGKPDNQEIIVQICNREFSVIYERIEV
jgi:hypothetical protein